MKVTTMNSGNTASKVIELSNEEFADVKKLGELISEVLKIEDDMKMVEKQAMSEEYRNADDERKVALFNELCQEMGYESGNDFAVKYEMRHKGVSEILAKAKEVITNLGE